MKSPSVVLSCEHAAFSLPARLRARFAYHPHVVFSHRGWDPGALVAAKMLSRRLGAPLVSGAITRLACDLNRSQENPEVFSEFTANLDEPTRLWLLRRYHRPHWAKVRSLIEAGLDHHRTVIHLAAHSFVPVLNGRVRYLDVGLLYDPASRSEQRLVATLRQDLNRRFPDLTVVDNQPYSGTDDALPTALRAHLGFRRYAGIEVELNQQLLDTPLRFSAIVRAIADSVNRVQVRG